jgi:hypothetical protein
MARSPKNKAFEAHFYYKVLTKTGQTVVSRMHLSLQADYATNAYNRKQD